MSRFLRFSKRTGLMLATVMALAAPVSSQAVAATAARSAPCWGAQPLTYSHVVWIMLENVGYPIVGSSSAPYFNELANECGLATNYLAVSHPSLPNYIALTSGSTQGISDDGEPSTHPLAVANIFSAWYQLEDLRRVDALGV